MNDSKLMQIFCRDAEKAIVTLKETLANGNIKLYTTTVHAMKSALANIGEVLTSEFALSLENAGISGDVAYISANTDKFIKQLEFLIKVQKPAETDDKVSEDFEEDSIYLLEQLRIIELACDDYDRDGAYAALDCLKEKAWKKDTAAAIDSIRDALELHTNFEGAAEQAVKLSGCSSNQQKTVLMVDDSSFMRTLIKRIIVRHGFRVVGEAENGKIGTEKYKMLKPDIVTMDFNMDEADGMEALDLILAHNPAANIIMVSSMMGMRPYAEAAMAKGAKAVTTKPVDEKKLIAAMQSLLS